MNRKEFEQLRSLPDKRIRADIRFVTIKNASPNLTFEDIPVENSLDWDVVVNGTYKPDVPAISFNFVIRGVGPICRLDVNGTRHLDVGRTHKHELRHDDDPRQNLPHAVARSDDLGVSSPSVIWRQLCLDASIEFLGEFTDP